MRLIPDEFYQHENVLGPVWMKKSRKNDLPMGGELKLFTWQIYFTHLILIYVPFICTYIFSVF